MNNDYLVSLTRGLEEARNSWPWSVSFEVKISHRMLTLISILHVNINREIDQEKPNKPVAR